MKSLTAKLRFAELNSKFATRLMSFWFKTGAHYRIPLGPLRGLRMVYDPRMNYHTILGLSDLRTFTLLRHTLKASGLLGKNAVYCDLGANMGLYSLWLSRLPGARLVHAFEPSPDMNSLLTENVKINSLSNIRIHKAAISDRVGEMEFFVTEGGATSSLIEEQCGAASTKAIRVETTTLDRLFGDSEVAPDFLKMDIEGGGAFALRACDKYLTNKRPLMYLESHNPDEDAAISRILSQHDYEAFRVQNLQWVKSPDKTHPNLDGVWGNLIVVPAERKVAVSKALKHAA